MSDRYWEPLERESVRENDNPDWREDHEAVVDAFAGKSGTGWLRVNCPRCEDKTGKPDKRASLGYNTATGGYNCQKCGMKGRLTDDERDELPYTEPARANEEQLPGAAEDPEPPWGYQPIFDGPAATADVFASARAYYLGRGLTAAVGQATGVGASTWGVNRDRIIVPLPDYERPGKLRGWAGRAYRAMPDLPDGTQPPTYRYARRFDRKQYLYNEPVLYEEGDEPVYAVEGTLDAHALWPDAVALLGKPLEYHVRCMRQALRPVVIVLDGDAWEEGLALALKLQFMGARAGAVRLEPGKDPDEVDRDALDLAASECIGYKSAVRLR